MHLYFPACSVSTFSIQNQKTRQTFAGNDLRTKLIAIKVAIGGKMDELKEIDLDTLTENQFDTRMTAIKKLVTDSKMLRVQVKAVARELVACLHVLFL